MKKVKIMLGLFLGMSLCVWSGYLLKENASLFFLPLWAGCIVIFIAFDYNNRQYEKDNI